MVAKCGAQILSQISNEQVTAYLLSESSLFVYDQHLTMITCGETQLVKATEHLVEEFGKENLEVLIYERKHEVLPHKQPTHFFEDVCALEKELKGRAFRFGDEDEHHLYLYHLDCDFIPSSDDNTLEVLMHGVPREVAEVFSKEKNVSEKVYEKTGILDIFPGFQCDDYLFEPQGYSLNAIKDDVYYTIHISPQEIGSYVSFETNFKFANKENRREVVRKLINLFRPSSFDIVLWEPKHDTEFSLGVDGYTGKNKINQRVSCGYNLGFYNYFKSEREKQAFEFNLETLAQV